jgi:hypothetical protein
MNIWRIANKRQGAVFLSHPRKITFFDYEIAYEVNLT